MQSKSESWAVQGLQFYVGNFKTPVYRSLNRDARMDNEEVELLIFQIFFSVLTVSRKKHSSVIVVITMEM